MIRHYEAIGLLDAAPRSDGGYRRYDERAVHTLRFVRRARNLGLAGRDPRPAVAVARPRAGQRRRKALTLRHVAESDQRIAELQSMRDTLDRLAQACSGDDRPDCPDPG